MNFEVMDNMKTKFLIFFLVIFIISCERFQNNILKDCIISNEFFDETEDTISGFLKKEILLQTPYGYMKTGPIGFDTGYQFDFMIYKNNRPKKIWLIENTKIKIDTMNFTVPAFSENKYSYIDFYDNYSIKTCRNAEPVLYSGLNIPKYSVFHFTPNGNLDCIVIYGETDFNGIRLQDGTVINVKNHNLEIKEYK